MISLFILKPNTRGMHYGVGTYLKQLTDSLMKYEDVNILIINYVSDRYKEFTISSAIPRLTEIYIPATVTKLKNQKQNFKYANRVVDFLVPFINTSPNPIFQVNYPDALPIVKQLKSRFSVPVLSVIHSAQWQFAFNGNKQKFIEGYAGIKEFDDILKKAIEYEKELYEISDKIISVTQYMREFIINYYNTSNGKIEVVPNGIDKTIFQETDCIDKESLKQSLGFGENERIVLFSGRLDKGKGLYFLLDAFTEVVKQFSNIRLLLVGDDSGPDKINMYLSHCLNIWGKVTFTGFVEYEVMKKLYLIADIGIVPSVYDHCPYTVLEMMAHKIPLVLSRINGLSEMLNDSQCIFIEPIVDGCGELSFNKDEITKAILFLVNDEEKVKQITRDYPELIYNKFSGEHMASEMHSVLKSLCKATVEIF